MGESVHPQVSTTGTPEAASMRVAVGVCMTPTSSTPSG